MWARGVSAPIERRLPRFYGTDSTEALGLPASPLKVLAYGALPRPREGGGIPERRKQISSGPEAGLPKMRR